METKLISTVFRETLVNYASMVYDLFGENDLISHFTTETTQIRCQLCGERITFDYAITDVNMQNFLHYDSVECTINQGGMAL